MDAHIEITKQDAEIEIMTHRARVEISTRRPQFRIRRDIAQMVVNRQMPTMHLDSSVVNSGIGIGPVMLAARDYFRNAAGSSVQQSSGSAVLSIQNGKLAVAESSFATPSKLNNGSAETALQAAEIRWDPGYLNVHWTPGSFDLDWDVSSWADITVEPQYVEIRMVKYPGIKIRVVYDPGATGKDGKIVDKYL